MTRALFMLLVLPLATFGEAQAQSGGIQVAPVMVTMTEAHNISSLRIRNGRDAPIAFEVDAYAWRQENGEDVLTPTTDLIVAPTVFEIRDGAEQIIRLGVLAPGGDTERAYRIILRELPRLHREGATLGFTLEMSLPVFVTPTDARANVLTEVRRGADESAVMLLNTGRAHAQLSAEEIGGARLEAPRYLLSGASARVAVSPRTETIRIRTAEAGGAQVERVIDVNRPSRAALVR
jgi:fimbrial chaperone protein